MHRRIVPPRFVRGGAFADGQTHEMIAGEVLALLFSMQNFNNMGKSTHFTGQQ